MNLIAIGTDLVEVSRIRSAIERHQRRLLDRVFTPGEQAYCEGLGAPWPSYAARFAAKEAIAKAFGTGIGAEFGWRDAGVVHSADGAPEFQLSRRAQELLQRSGGGKVLLSLTHTRDYAQAMVAIVASPGG